MINALRRCDGHQSCFAPGGGQCAVIFDYYFSDSQRSLNATNPVLREADKVQDEDERDL